MGRPIYPYEMVDPDFSWLISNFQENNPHYTAVEDGCLPVVFIGGGYQPAESPFRQDPPYPEESVAQEEDSSKHREIDDVSEQG